LAKKQVFQATNIIGYPYVADLVVFLLLSSGWVEKRKEREEIIFDIQYEKAYIDFVPLVFLSYI
jgi:hypothetical protein